MKYRGFNFIIMIYVLKGFRDESSFVIGVSDCPFKAADMKTEYLTKLKELQNRYTEEAINILDAEIEELGFEFCSKKAKDFYMWECEFYYRDYYADVKIEEYNLNTIDYDTIFNNLTTH